jgi:hypothetical protein
MRKDRAWPASRLMLTAVGLCLFLRVPAAFLVYGTSDVTNLFALPGALFDGELLHFYSRLPSNYSPFIPWLLWPFRFLSEAAGLPFWGMIKVPSIISDCVITALIFSAVLRLNSDRSSAFKAALLYAVNPVSFFVTSVHGQLDPMVIMFCLAAWYYFEFAQSARDKIFSALFLGAAIAAKNYPVILIPFFLFRERTVKERLRYLALSLLPVAAFSLPYFLATPGLFLKSVAGYAPRFGYWGYMLVLTILKKHFSLGLFPWLYEQGNHYGKYLLLALLAGYYLRSRGRTRLIDDIAIAFLLLLTFTSGFGSQYLIWPIPFALVTRAQRLEKTYTAYVVFCSLWLGCLYMELYSPALYARSIALIGESLFWKFSTLFSLSAWLGTGLLLTLKIKNGLEKNPGRSAAGI